jgi:S1-C subfamily serine protease
VSAPAAGNAAAAGTTFTVARREIDVALADFGATAATFDATFVASGLRIDAVHAGTILSRLGLRAGDVITSVDGLPLRSFDDAASLYARANSVRSATIRVIRGGTPTTLRVDIQ